MLNKERNTYTEQSVPEQRKERREALLTRVECDALRGLAIIGIFLHNYCHWLRPVVKGRTEISVFSTQCRQTLSSVTRVVERIVFSFIFYRSLGIMEYLLFLFLSAYGLTMKYEKLTANSANKYAAVTIKSSSLWFYQISLGKAFPYDDSWLCGFYDG